MILIDIIACAFNKVYDFQIDETVLVSSVTEEIDEVITQKEQCVSVQSHENMLLFTQEGKLLPANLTLNQCGVKTGDKLILV